MHQITMSSFQQQSPINYIAITTELTLLEMGDYPECPLVQAVINMMAQGFGITNHPWLELIKV